MEKNKNFDMNHISEPGRTNIIMFAEVIDHLQKKTGKSQKEIIKEFCNEQKRTKRNRV